jgi:hypothetical protein
MRAIVVCLSRFSLGILLLLALTVPAAAQEQWADQRGNVAVGYGILHDSDAEETFPTGWMFTVTGNVGKMLGIVGEVGGSYKSVDFLGSDANLRVHSFLGGIRFMNQAQRAIPFAQFLVGAATRNASFALVDLSETSTGLAFQPGGGVDIRANEKFGLRVQGDYRIIRSDGETSNEFRFAVGAVFGF